jgi:hypothetical protein
MTAVANRTSKQSGRSTVRPTADSSNASKRTTHDHEQRTAPLPIKTRRRCIMYILESLAAGRPLSMDEMMQVLVRSAPQVRRLLATIRHLYMIRIVLRKGRYQLDHRYNPEEILGVAYKILRGNDRSACERILYMNLNRLGRTEESIAGLRQMSSN